ncbi:hypothetical protein NC653_016035 [Populus alba x Populus x berolinensis]|uniref:Uncharacterized protein n=1 Tax=Populus alba x Populus x berolinensis TaxID=444605 RepID=A0AAD6VZ59_9ROSI|nr:hypothetical protein NC653_016035 [Populus alba x Populus x berolinensis]
MDRRVSSAFGEGSFLRIALKSFIKGRKGEEVAWKQKYKPLTDSVPVILPYSSYHAARDHRGMAYPLLQGWEDLSSSLLIDTIWDLISLLLTGTRADHSVLEMKEDCSRPAAASSDLFNS